MKGTTITQLIGMAMGIAGVLLMGFMVSWWAALAAFLMVWGNNCERTARE